MSRLYIADNDDSSKPNTDGYSNFVQNAILNARNFDAFVRAHDDERADLVQTHAGSDQRGRKCVVTQLTIDRVSEPIDGGNCLVELKEDLQKKRTASKHNISLPARWTRHDETPDISYLDKYVTALSDLAGTDPVKARNFLFGLMLLTRCR